MTSESQSQEARCHCGHLVAKLRTTGVELKCKRCKRLLLIPFRSDTVPLSKLLSASAETVGGHNRK